MNFFKKCFCILIISLTATFAFADGFFFAEIPSGEKCVALDADDPFALDAVLDSAVGTLALGSLAAATIIKYAGGLPAYDPSVVYDKSDVNSFDRWAINPYSRPLDKTADFVLVAEVGLFPVVTFGLETAFGNLPLMSLLKIGVMYAESYILSLGIKNLLKVVVLRPRPYMYFDSRDTNALSGQDWHFSWPSGHSTSVFMGATFLSYVFCTYYPQSSWKIPVVAVSYSVAAGVAALRMLSGNHYFTDVIGGALLGAFCGFTVPFVHHLVAEAKANKKSDSGASLENVAVIPNGVLVTLSFRSR